MDTGSEFQGLVRKYLNSLYNYALVLTRRVEDAEDLLQESLVRAYDGFHTFDRSLSFKPWIFTIMRNVQIDRQRRRRVRPAEDPLGREEEAEPVVSMESPLYSIPLAPEDILLRRETVDQVREAIRRLPPLLREIVELRDIEGLPYREIATIVSRPVGTVMSRLYRGRNLLRTYLVEPSQRPGEKGIGVRNDGL
ncbi:MAG TPA: sigma-70 family RNA polymerase sigma factor [Methylomirabilota bacterium]|nr:sigma-70 family RNA polymerase sigma factor [Methylomirabilota bacterium]